MKITKSTAVLVNVLAWASVIAIASAIWAWFGWPAALLFSGIVGLFISVSVVISDRE